VLVQPFGFAREEEGCRHHQAGGCLKANWQGWEEWHTSPWALGLSPVLQLQSEEEEEEEEEEEGGRKGDRDGAPAQLVEEVGFGGMMGIRCGSARPRPMNSLSGTLRPHYKKYLCNSQSQSHVVVM
jgi:hypothetical protein